MFDLQLSSIYSCCSNWSLLPSWIGRGVHQGRCPSHSLHDFCEYSYKCWTQLIVTFSLQFLLCHRCNNSNIQFCLAIYILLLLFEDLPFSMITCGILSHIIHLLILQNFPYFEFTSIPFILGCLFVIVNHYLAFTYFASKFVPFSQVLGYFTICLWIVPFTFFISLSANDNVLPVTIGGDHQEGRPLLNDIDGDVVSSIFSRKNKKLSLLSFFNYAKESLLPQRVKKSF